MALQGVEKMKKVPHCNAAGLAMPTYLPSANSSSDSRRRPFPQHLFSCYDPIALPIHHPSRT